MYKKSCRWRYLVLSLPLSLMVFPALSQAACNAGDVGGTAYLELPVAPGGQTANTYGVRDGNEPGLANIAVKVVDNSGVEQTVTTDSSGAWSVVTPAFPVRVEFSAANVSSSLHSGSVGTQSQSSVRFIATTSCNTDMGFQRPEDYSQPDPRLMIPGHRNSIGDTLTDGGVFSFPRSYQGLNSEFYSADGAQGSGPIPDKEATVAQVGSLWGIAWQPTQKRAFAAAFLKRHVGLRNGLSTVYVFDETTAPGTLAGSFNLQGVTPANGGAPIDLGSVCRDASCAGDPGNTGNAADYQLASQLSEPSIDMDAFYKVGTVGFGDIDMQPGTNTLWLINANQKALISMDASGSTAALASATVNQYPFSALSGTPSCTGGQIHPWALGFFEGKGYVGLTCDAIDSQNVDDLHAYIMRFNPAKVTDGLTPVLDFSLNYPRDDDYKRFQPWMTPSVAANKLAGTGGQIDFPHGVLSDIDFDENGNLYFEIMDLFAHQTGNYNHLPFSNDNSWVNGIANGDVLKACKTPIGFSLEGTADCAVNFTSNAVGPNAAGEFFNDQVGDGRAEGVSGSIALLRGSQQMDTATMDPHPEGVTGVPYWSTQGIMTFSLNDGKVVNWYTLNSTSQDGFMSKGTGFGDIELLSAAAPVEIGNRVWLDQNANGIQDANETGIDNIQVKLTCGADAATATTANGGAYLFSNAVGGNATFMDAGENCTLSIPTGQALLSTYLVTTANADNATDNNPATDIRDSDANATGEIAFTVGNVGENNHSLDVGYKPLPHSLGNRVWIDANNNGLADVGESAVPANVKLELKDNGGAVLNTTTTDANGRYLFSGLAVGSYQVCVTADNFSSGGVLQDYTASNGGDVADANTDVDGDDNGDNDTTKGLCSNLVVLNEAEPVLEATVTGDDGNDGQGTADANSNLTVDFGVVPPVLKTDLQLTKTVDKASVKPGDTVIYSVTVTNESSTDATGVQVSDALPARMLYVSDDSAGAYNVTSGIWQVGNLAKGETKTLQLTVTIQ